MKYIIAFILGYLAPLVSANASVIDDISRKMGGAANKIEKINEALSVGSGITDSPVIGIVLYCLGAIFLFVVVILIVFLLVMLLKR